VIFDLIFFMTINLVVMWALLQPISYAMNLLRISIPRYLCSALIYVIVQCYLYLFQSDFGIIMSIIIAVAYSLIGMIFGLLLGLFINNKRVFTAKLITFLA